MDNKYKDTDLLLIKLYEELYIKNDKDDVIKTINTIFEYYYEVCPEDSVSFLNKCDDTMKNFIIDSIIKKFSNNIYFDSMYDNSYDIRDRFNNKYKDELKNNEKNKYKINRNYIRIMNKKYFQLKELTEKEKFIIYNTLISNKSYIDMIIDKGRIINYLYYDNRDKMLLFNYNKSISLFIDYLEYFPEETDRVIKAFDISINNYGREKLLKEFISVKRLIKINSDYNYTKEFNTNMKLLLYNKDCKLVTEYLHDLYFDIINNNLEDTIKYLEYLFVDTNYIVDKEYTLDDLFKNNFLLFLIKGKIDNDIVKRYILDILINDIKK